MTSAGLFTGISMPAYLKMKALSASILNAIDQRCPQAAWHESWLNEHRDDEEMTKEQGVGVVAHSVLLEGSTDCVRVINPEDHAGTRGGIPKGWTNDSIRAARDLAIADGKIPVFPAKMVEIERMVAAARVFLDSVRPKQRAIWEAMQPGGGESEVVITWADDVDGTPCKIRPDRISLDRRIMVNYKTTLASAEPAGWYRRQATSMGFPLANAFYRRGVRSALGIESEEFWLVQEQEAPYLCSLVGLPPMGLDAAELRMLKALQTWAACFKANRWAGYPADVAYPEIPPWEISRAEQEPHGFPYDPEQLFGEKSEWQARMDALPRDE